MSFHFASKGKRVMRDYDFAKGTVIDDSERTKNGTVAVQWDEEKEPTLIYTFELEPAE